MQPIAPVTSDQLLAPGQVPLMKLELYDGDYWVNICDGFSFLLSPCDAVTDWTGTALSIDTDDKKEGTGSLKDDVATPVINTEYSTGYNPAGSWDWSAKKHILFWLKSDRASTAFDYTLVIIYDTLGNYRYWVLTFSAGEWTAVKLLLSTGYFETPTPPDLALINYVAVIFRTADTTPFYRKIDDLRIDDVEPGLKGKNYVEGVSVSLGGASMTPNPVGGAWNAMLGNKDSIFHPKHPTSAYKDYCVTGRKARISIGATYGGIDYYWQRLIGFMDEPSFEAPSYKVSISGADYMKVLEETKFKDLDNYWGTSAVFSSIASDGKIGSEIYNEVDAMDINNEANNVTNWPVTGACTFSSEADAGAGSVYVGKLISTDSDAYTKNLNVGTVVAGVEYRVSFKYRRVTGTGKLRVSIWQQYNGVDEHQLNFIANLDSLSYETASFYFTADVDGPIIMKAAIWDITAGTHQFRIDQISIWNFTPYWKRYYELPEASKGPHYVTLDGNPVWQGEEDEGWFHEESTRRVFFDINKVVANGTDNIVIYYFTSESLENVVADILVKGHLYADRAAALAAMEYTATGISIDMIRFKAGSTYLNAIKKICERCDYRFHFKYDGIPVFKPKPAPGSVSFAFTDPKHIAAVRNYQDRSEIKNRIIIKGLKQAEPVSRDETMPSELRGEVYDQISIDLYGERTLAIDNDLFQDQGSIDAMKATLLAEYKDPKLYADIEMSFRPVPLELGDKMSWKERLSPVLDITQEGVIRDIKIDNFNTTYRCEI